MKRLFLMSVFSMFMAAAVSAPAFAHGDDNENDDGGASAFQCPDGVAQCYRADGSLVTNVNYLPATAAGDEIDDDGHQAATPTNPTLPKVVAPKHFSTF